MFANLLLIITVVARIMPVAECSWLETTQQDFRDGTFERNLYASHRQGGAVEFTPRFDLNNDGYIDIFVNPYGGSNYIYWGDAYGYSSTRRTAYPCGSGGSCDAADLNLDGYADYVISKYYSASITIFWGRASGPDPYNVTSIPLGDGSNETILIEDFNRDGYLDIAAGNYRGGSAAVFWGSATGYSANNRTELPVVGLCAYNIEAADLNKDNWLDLLFVNREGSSNYVYWGSSAGFSASNRAVIPFLSTYPHGASIADLNGDDWLDLVFTGCDAISQAYIWWGSTAGFQTRQVLNIGGPAMGGSSVNDMNGDGYLDIVFFRGQLATLQPVIYWGSANGYSDQNRTDFGVAMIACGGFVADFNYDGWLDIFANNFNGSGSYVFWGRSFNTNQPISGIGRDHHSMAREAGNTYTRRYAEDYVSSVFDAQYVANWKKLIYSDSTPAGTSVTLYLRSGNTPVPDSTWRSWAQVPNGGPIPGALRARYIQYKTLFSYINPSRLPVLHQVEIQYGAALEAAIDIDPNVINRRSSGQWISAYIELPVEYPVDSISVATVKFEYNGTGINCELHPTEIGDHNGNGVADLMVKFDRQRVITILQPGIAVVTVAGALLNGTGFSGQDTIMVIDPGHQQLFAEIFPNPFDSKAAITYGVDGERSAVPQGHKITLKIYDAAGRCVKSLVDRPLGNGLNTVVWDGKKDNGVTLPNGTYFVHLRTLQGSLVKKMIILR